MIAPEYPSTLESTKDASFNRNKLLDSFPTLEPSTHIVPGRELVAETHNWKQGENNLGNHEREPQ